MTHHHHMNRRIVCGPARRSATAGLIPARGLRRAALAGVALALCAFAAEARMIDLSKSTCAQFKALAPADKEQVVLWLGGYFAGAAQQPTLDTTRLSAASKAMDEMCAKTPAAPLIGQETRPLFLGPAAP
jgi:HdeA/HdeB family